MSAKEDFADFNFQVECGDMILTKAGGAALSIRGPGEVWQNQDGVLEFKIFAAQGYRELQVYPSRPGVIGQPIPSEEFFTLDAIEHSSPRWFASQIMPGTRGGITQGLAHGFINELTQTETIPANQESDFVVIRLKGKIKFPCNQNTKTTVHVAGHERQSSSSFNVALVIDGELRIEMRHESEHTSFSLELPAGQLKPTTPSRIHEALQFVLGQQLALVGIETISGKQHITRLISPNRGTGNLPPPLEFDHRPTDKDVWKIFTCYFRHIHNSNIDGWHPISRNIGSVIESTVASIEIEVLALVVAVEGLASECFPNTAPTDPHLLEELDSIQAAIDRIDLREETRKRIHGTLCATRSPRNSDLLRAFVKNHDLDSGFYNSWSRLRNTSAHGAGLGRRNRTGALQLRFEVISLLYSIVFAAIGYRGPRTEYSIPNWPIKNWPINR